MAVTNSTPSQGSQSFRVINTTADITLTKDQFPCIVTNEGAAAQVTVTLPTDCDGGEEIILGVMTAQDLIAAPGTGGRITVAAGHVTANAGQLEADAIGECLRLVNVTGQQWLATEERGTWGAPA